MLRFLLVFTFVMCSLSVNAEELGRWKFNDDKSIEKATLWVDTNSGARASKDFVSGEKGGYLRVSIYNGKLHPSKIQLSFKSGVTIRAGERYTVEFTAKTINKQRFLLQCTQNASPYNALGKDSTFEVVTKDDNWNKYSFGFIADKDLTGLCRIPVFLLGNMSSDAQIDISEVIFSGSSDKKEGKQESSAATITEQKKKLTGA